MKKARSFSLTGEFERVVRAGDVPESERHKHDFKCLDPNCEAHFHLVKSHRRKENTEKIEATFARNAGSKHKDGCDYDYETIAKKHRYQSFVRDGKFYLRVNFPLGGKYSDRHPERGGLTRTQRAAAERNTDKKPVASMEALTKFLEKEFGSLQSESLENLVLDYQGKSYPWPEVFTNADNYERLHTEAAKQDERNALLTTVVPARAGSENSKGKSRILCEPQDVELNGQHQLIQPVLVCETTELARKIRMGQALLVATRPYVSPEALSKPPEPGQKLNIYLYIHEAAQIAPVRGAVLHKPLLMATRTSRQLDLFEAKP